MPRPSSDIRVHDHLATARVYSAAIGIGSGVLAAGGILVGGALGWVLAVLFAIAAVLLLVEAIRPARVLLAVEARGLTVHGAPAPIPWSAIAEAGIDPGVQEHEGEEPEPFVWVRVRADHPIADELARRNPRAIDPLRLAIPYAQPAPAELLAAIEARLARGS